jgi:di/tricarboxylate transporter
MLNAKARYLLVTFPLKSLSLGVIAGLLSYVFLGLLPGVSPVQQIIALFGWPIIVGIFGLLWGVKEYRRQR